MRGPDRGGRIVTRDFQRETMGFLTGKVRDEPKRESKHRDTTEARRTERTQMRRRIIGPKFYAARGDETTGPYLDSWRAFQRINERYRPRSLTSGRYRPCLVSNVGYGSRRVGCAQAPCPACGTEVEIERLFDHEESWYVIEGNQRQAIRLAHPYLRPDEIEDRLLALFNKFPPDAARNLVGYIGPPNDDWYLGPMTTGFLVQHRAIAGPVGWKPVHHNADAANNADKDAWGDPTLIDLV